jgi:hypothetical protein
MPNRNRYNSNALELSEFEKCTIIVVYANPKTKRSDIALLTGLTLKELRRLLNLKSGKRLVAWLEAKGPPSSFTNHHITEHIPVPYALKFYLKERVNEAKD